MGFVVFILLLASYATRTSGGRFPISNWVLGLSGGTVVALAASSCWSALQQRERDGELERLQQDVNYLASRQSHLEQVTGAQVEQFSMLQQYVMSLGASSENRNSAAGFSGAVPDGRLAGGGQTDSAASRLPQSPGGSPTLQYPLQPTDNQQTPSQSIQSTQLRPAQQQQLSQPAKPTNRSAVQADPSAQSAVRPVQQPVSQPTQSAQSTQLAQPTQSAQFSSNRQPVQQSVQSTSSQPVRANSSVQTSNSSANSNGRSSNSTDMRPTVPQAVSRPVQSTQSTSSQLSEEDLIIQQLVASQSSLQDEWDTPISN